MKKHLFKVGQRVEVRKAPMMSGELVSYQGVVLGYHKDLGVLSGEPWALVGFAPYVRKRHPGLHNGNDTCTEAVPAEYRGRCWYIDQTLLRRVSPPPKSTK